MKPGEKQRILERNYTKLKQARQLLEEIERDFTKFDDPADLIMPDEVKEALDQISVPISVIEDGFAKNQW